MGFLCAGGLVLPTRNGRFSARRAGSIGTLSCARQSYRTLRLGFVLAASFCFVFPRAARAAEATAAPVETDLPTPPPPTSFAGEPNGPLPPPPPPKTSAGSPPSGAEPSPPPVAVPARPGAPGSDLPPLPPAPRGARLHDGFYLRLGVGLGLGGALISSDSKSVGDYSFGGGAGAFDAWIGGTPLTGLAMGAAISGVGLGSSERSVDGNRVSGDVSGSSGLLGYFVDVFPDPERGLHFGGALGLASARAEVKDSGRKFEGGGLGLQAWGGYEFWVSPQWSLGGMLRFIGSMTREEEAGVAYRASLGAATLSFTALYH